MKVRMDAILKKRCGGPKNLIHTGSPNTKAPDTAIMT